MNPVELFLKEKKAGFSDSFRSGAKGIPGAMGSAVAQGIATAGVGAGLAGLGLAASKIVDAMTKKRDFQGMLQSNPDLIEHHEANPHQFNQMFSTLRMMNPQFSKDPIVAGTYMRRMVENPLTAGGVAVEALGHRDAGNKSNVMDSFVRGGLEGAKGGVSSSFKKRPPTDSEE